MIDHEGDIFFFLYGKGMREKEDLKGGIRAAIFVAIRWRLKVVNNKLQNDVVSLSLSPPPPPPPPLCVCVCVFKINKRILFKIKGVVWSFGFKLGLNLFF
jgi:hypothetical protein